MTNYKYLYFQLLEEVAEVIELLDNSINDLDTAAYTLDTSRERIIKLQLKARMIPIDR